MALVKMSSLLKKASEENQAVGAFNVFNMEMLMGVIKAAEEEKTDIIIQIAEKRLPYSPLGFIAPIMVNAAKKSSVNVAVQLDHSHTDAVMQDAIKYGFTSVMYDGSEYSIEENILRTKRVLEWARANNADLEAEIGVLAGDEGAGDMTANYTKPEEAIHFANETKCSALAIAIGNVHGHYKGSPKLNFDILEKISKKIAVPIVLHGGTGIPESDIKKAISLGVRKINVATANMDAVVNAAIECSRDKVDFNYFDLSSRMVDNVYLSVREHIAIFNNKK